MGNDSKVLARTGKYVDLWGVDDHKVDDLELVTAGAVVETQTGPIIIIMNQYARMANGKTIHSAGQMEHHKVIVKDQAHAITGEVPYIQLHEGHRTPLCFINGLPYMKMRIPTAKELETLPRVTITSDAPWDPRILDFDPPDEWFTNQPKCLELIEESIFDVHGGYKESLPVYPEDDAEKVMDAEVTDDDPNHIEDDDRDAPMVEVSRASIKAYLHNIVQDEIVPAYRVFRVGRHLHEVDIDHRKGHPASREKSKWEKTPHPGHTTLSQGSPPTSPSRGQEEAATPSHCRAHRGHRHADQDDGRQPTGPGQGRWSPRSGPTQDGLQ